MQAFSGLTKPGQAVSVAPCPFECDRDTFCGVHGTQIAECARHAGTTDSIDLRQVERVFATHRSAVVDRILDVVATPTRQQQFQRSRRIAIEAVQRRSRAKCRDSDSTTGLSRYIQSLVPCGWCATNHEDARRPLVDPLVAKQTFDDSLADSFVGGLASGESTVARGCELASGSPRGAGDHAGGSYRQRSPTRPKGPKCCRRARTWRRPAPLRRTGRTVGRVRLGLTRRARLGRTAWPVCSRLSHWGRAAPR